MAWPHGEQDLTTHERKHPPSNREHITAREGGDTHIMKITESQFTIQDGKVFIGTSEVVEVRPVENRPEVVRLVGPELGLTFIASYEVPDEVIEVLP
jgi:hypothetical protein